MEVKDQETVKEATPAQPEVKPDTLVGTTEGDTPSQKPAQESQKPEWFKADKYKTVEDQAKAYPESEKAMSKAQQEASDTKKELEKLRAEREQPPEQQQSQAPQYGVNTVPADVRERIEAQYGHQVPFEQIQAMKDIVDMSMRPVKDNLYNSQVDQKLQGMATSNPVVKEYGDEIRATLQKYSPEDRVQPKTINWVVQAVTGRHMQELQQKWIEQGKKEASVNPNVPYSGEAGGGAAPSPQSSGSRIKLSDKQKEVDARYGGKPGETEKVLNEMYDEGNYK